MWTSLPAIVVEDSADGHVVKVKSAVKMQQRMQDGTVKNVEIAAGSDGKSKGWGHVPVHFPSAGGVAHTFPIKKGDEGILVFSARTIDGWWQNGDVQPMPYARRHSLSDAMFIPGIRSTPRKLSSVSTTSSQLRTEDGKTYVELASDGSNIRLVMNGGEAFFEITKDGVLNIKAAGGVNILKGDLKVTDEIVAKSGSLNIHLSTHRESGVQPGGGQSGPPVPGS